MLEDIATLTGGKVITEDLGIKLEAITTEDLGKAKKVTIDKDNTTIVEGSGSADAIDGRIKTIRNQIEDTEAAKKELIAGIDGRKVQFHALPEAERQQWAKASEAFIVEWSDKMEKAGIDAKAFRKRLADVTAKYEADLKANGYPWRKKTN